MPLYNYISASFLVFFKSELSQLTADESEVFKNLNDEYFHYAFHASNLDYKDLNTHEFDFKFYEELLKQAEKVFEKKFTSYLEYYDYLRDKCEEGTNRFDILFGKKLRLNSDFKRIDL